MLKFPYVPRENRPLWGRGILSPIYSFFHPVPDEKIEQTRKELRAAWAKTDATMAKADATMARADATMAKADATIAKVDESSKKTEAAIANARDFLQRVEDYKRLSQQGEDVSPPAPSSSL